MLIILKNDIPAQYACVGAAHAALAGYLKWEDDELTYQWAHGIFYKHIKSASPVEFEKAKLAKYGDKIVITESAVEDDVAIVYRVQEDYPEFLKTLPKWVCKCYTQEKIF